LSDDHSHLVVVTTQKPVGHYGAFFLILERV